MCVNTRCFLFGSNSSFVGLLFSEPFSTPPKSTLAVLFSIPSSFRVVRSRHSSFTFRAAPKSDLLSRKSDYLWKRPSTLANWTDALFCIEILLCADVSCGNKHNGGSERPSHSTLLLCPWRTLFSDCCSCRTPNVMQCKRSGCQHCA